MEKNAMCTCTLQISISAGGYHLKPISTVSERKQKEINFCHMILVNAFVSTEIYSHNRNLYK